MINENKIGQLYNYSVLIISKVIIIMINDMKKIGKFIKVAVL